MTITAVFENLNEVKEFAEMFRGLDVRKETPDQAGGNTAAVTSQPVQDVQETPAEPEEEDTTAENDEDAAGAGAQEEAPAYTLVDVRGRLAALTKAGKKAQVQELIKGFGADKLSQIPENKYAELMQKAGEL